MTISRGKKGVHIFTTDKEQLRENITRSGERLSAMDMLAAHYRNDPFYRRVVQRWGRRAAVLMTLGKRANKNRAIRQARTQIQSVDQQPASRGVRI